MDKKFVGKIMAAMVLVVMIFSMMPGMTFFVRARDYVDIINFNDVQPNVYYHFTDVAVFGQDMVDNGYNGVMGLGFTRPTLVGSANVYGDLSLFPTGPNFGLPGSGALNIYGMSNSLAFGADTNHDFYFIASNAGTYTFDAMISDELYNEEYFYQINITVVATNTPPTVSVNTGVTVNEGDSVTISNTKLKATDTQTTDASLLTYKLTTAPSKGTLYNNGSSLALNSTFTQANIDNSKITYTHDGSETTSDSFGFSVSDGTDSVTGKTFAITVTPVNDAPVITSKAPTLISVSADNTSNSGQTVDSFAGTSISDNDSGAVKGIAITAVVNGNGTWEYSTNAGTSWSSIGAVAQNSALLLRSSDLVRFVPNGANETTASITYRAWDRTSGTQGTKADTTTNGGTTAFSTAADTASITVTDVNDAPVLTAASPSLVTITEDDTNNSGQLISSFLGNTISDADAAALEGIAVVGFMGNGTWQYSVDGVNWNNIGSISGTSALLLNDTDKIRYIPNGQNAESASITYRAWDRTSGSSGTKANTSSNGGKTAFSTATDTAAITVTALNDAPVLAVATPLLTSVTEDDTANGGQTTASIIGATISDVDNGAVNGIAITSITSGNGTWEYSIDNGDTWTPFGEVSTTNALLLKSTDKVRFVPNGQSGTTANITYRAWDQTTGLAGNQADTTANGGTTAFSTALNTASITVTDVNDNPTLSSISKFTGAQKNVAFTISFDALLTAADEADIDSSNICFQIAELKSNGTLTKGGVPVTVGTTFLPHEVLVWTPNTYGTGVEAFTVKAYDGSSLSANAVAVTVDVSNEITPAPISDVAMGSTVKKGSSITLLSDSGSTIHYTTGAGNIPNDPDATSDSIVSGEAITIDGDYGQTVTVKAYAVSNSGKDDSSIATFTYTIKAKKTLTITGLSVKAKDYDGNVTAILEGTAVLSGDKTLNDDVIISGTPSAVFANKTAEAGKPVTVSGYELSGNDAQYYDLEQPSGLTGTINAKQISVGTVTVENKTYDGSTAATVSSITLSGVLGDDKVITTFTSSLFRSADKGEQTVDITGISLSGDDALNYLLSSTSATATATINAKELTPSATAADKVYNGNTDATVSVKLDGIISPDAVTATFTANFRDADAGTDKTIDVTNIKLDGVDFENYYLSTDNLTVTANITPKSTTITMNEANYVYDGSAKSLTASNTDNIEMKYTNNGQIDAGTYTVTAESSNPNYSGSATATLTISQAELTVTGLTASDKTYDGTTAAALTGGVLSGKIGADDVTAEMPTSGTFAGKDVETGIGVTVPTISLSGEKAGNYTLKQPTGLTADITKKSLKIKANDTTITYGDAPAANGVTYDGFENGETYSVLTDSLVYEFNYAKFGNVGDYTITPSGLKSNNYEITFENGKLSVNAKPLTLDASADSKIYDGTTNATGKLIVNGTVNNDIVTASGTFVFENSNAGEEKTVDVTDITIAGAKSGNYTVNASATTTADINKAEINGIIFTGSTETYDGTEKSIAIEGALPSGASVSYTNNKGINAGSYNATATITGGTNYNNKTLDATLTINKADISGITFTDSTVTYDRKEKTLAIEGTLPSGASVSYTNNKGTDIGTYNATANIAGGINYKDLVLNAVLSIIAETENDVKVTVSVNNDYNGDWTKDDVTFELSGSAPSDIMKYQYSTDGSNWFDMNANSLIVDSTTNASYSFRAVSNGNVLSQASTPFAVKVDKTVPVIKDFGNPTVPVNEEQTITLTVNDSDSGIDNQGIIIKKGDTVVAENTLSFKTQGNGTYIISVMDNVGNIADLTVDVTKLDFGKPLVSALSPANNATDVDVDSLTVTFNENIKKSSINGDIIVSRADGSVFEKVDIQNNRVKISNDQMKIYFTKPLETSNSYFVTIAKGIILDLGGNSFDGIIDNSVWAFKTKRVSVINSLIGIDVTVQNEKYPAVVDSADDTKYTALAKSNADGTIDATLIPKFLINSKSFVITPKEDGVTVNGNKIKITDPEKKQATINLQVEDSDTIYTLIIIKGTLQTKVENTIANATVDSVDLKGAIDVSSDIDAGKQLELVLNVKDNESLLTDEQKSEINNVINNQSIALYLDISLILSNITDNTTTAVSNTQNPITISIEIPKSMRGGSDYKIVRSHDGIVEIINATVEGNYLVFETDRFSQYAVAYTPSVPKPTTPSKATTRHGGGSVIVIADNVHTPYINGYPDGTFKPDGQITRAETAAILSRVSDGYNADFYYQADFKDLETNGWYLNTVGYGSQNGLLVGYEDGSFHPNGQITRAEFATIIARSLKLDAQVTGTSLSDISGHWAEGYIAVLFAKGFISGYEDGTFRPDASITRAEAVKIINAALGRTPNKDKIDVNISNYSNPFSDIVGAHWAYYDIIEAAISHVVSDFN